VERQLFAGAGAGTKVFWAGSGSGFVNSYERLQKALHFLFLKFEVKFKKYFFVTIYFKEPFEF
jgi:hypothetical protein